MIKKILALLLTLLMLLSISSLPAFASSVDKRIPEDAFTFNGHYYKVYTGECKNWKKAKEYCEDMDGYLAVISSKEENDALYQYLLSLGLQTAYFGLSDHENHGEWVWVEQEQSDFFNWYPTEPNGELGEHYAEFYWKFTDGTWNDGNFGFGTASDDKSFICEWDPASMSEASTFPIWPIFVILLLIAGLVFFLLIKFGRPHRKTPNYSNPEYVSKSRR